MNLFCVGDVHGRIPEYQLLLKRQIPENSTVIQVGDLGCGFTELPETFNRSWVTHKFIRGNHDSPKIARTHKDYLGDYGAFPFEGGPTVFFLGGAWSIDHAQRSPGKDWWWDEQLGWEQLEDALKLYQEAQPTLVITHDAPTTVKEAILGEPTTILPTRTDQVLQRMLDSWQPEIWIFGHYHKKWNGQFGKTMFRCLPELGVTQVKVS